ncbi:hypothetical protein, partial [Microcystis aeruginosa]|uniref:hypothetical protein n=1 Tax=Microcystis aeruginosa TaxID=1126 RepID=UPI001C12AB26
MYTGLGKLSIQSEKWRSGVVLFLNVKFCYEIQHFWINGPLIRLILIRLDEKDHILLTHIHDIIIDNSSLTLFFKELE